MTTSRPGDLPAHLLDVSCAHQRPLEQAVRTALGDGPGSIRAYSDRRSAVSICVEVGHQDVDDVCDRCGLPRTA